MNIVLVLIFKAFNGLRSSCLKYCLSFHDQDLLRNKGEQEYKPSKKYILKKIYLSLDIAREEETEAFVFYIP